MIRTRIPIFVTGQDVSLISLRFLVAMGLLKFRVDFCVSAESVRAQYADAANTFTSGFFPSATTFLPVASIYLVLATTPLTLLI